jgi:hypothetical protein
MRESDTRVEGVLFWVMEIASRSVDFYLVDEFRGHLGFPCAGV